MKNPLPAAMFCLAWCAGLAVAAEGTATRPAAPPEALDADSAQQVLAIRQAAGRLIANGTASDVAAGANLLNRATEIEQTRLAVMKLAAEREKLDKESADADRGRWKDAVATLAPLLSTLILAGTLGLQTWQARVAERERRADAERQAKADLHKRFTEAVAIIGKVEKVSQTATLLNTFNGTEHEDAAREFALQILMQQKSAAAFREFFVAVLDRQGPAYLPMLLHVGRGIHVELLPLSRAGWNYETNVFSRDRIPADRLQDYDRLVGEDAFLSEKLAARLKVPRAPGDDLDLRSVGLTNCEIRGADLRGAILTSAVWTNVDVSGCDLSGITEFFDAGFNGVAWWRAAKIDRPFLDFLVQNYPYRGVDEYYRTEAAGTIQPSDYDDNLRRLRAASGATA